MLSVLSTDQEKFKMVNCRITFGNKWLLPRAKRRLSTLYLLLTCNLFSISFVYPNLLILSLSTPSPILCHISFQVISYYTCVVFHLL